MLTDIYFPCLGLGTLMTAVTTTASGGAVLHWGTSFLYYCLHTPQIHISWISLPKSIIFNSIILNFIFLSLFSLSLIELIQVNVFNYFKFSVTVPTCSV